jgi:hypothetical protein
LISKIFKHILRFSIKDNISREVLVTLIKCNALVVQPEGEEHCVEIAHREHIIKEEQL